MSTTQQGFDFGAAVQGEAFHPSAVEVCPKGNYVFRIVDVQLATTKSVNAYPMLKLRLECEEGVQWDNLVISPNEFSMQKVLGLIDSAGLPRPVVGTDMDPQTGRLSDAYAAKLNGALVGGIVRDEQEVDNRTDSPTRGQEITRPRIKGYQPPEKIKPFTGNTGNAGAAPSAPVHSGHDADIPF